MLYRGGDRARLAQMKETARRAQVPLLAVNDVHFHHPDRRTLADVLTCIREKTTIDRAGRLLAANASASSSRLRKWHASSVTRRRRSRKRCA